MLFSYAVYENAKQPLKTSKRSKISFYLPPKTLILPHPPHPHYWTYCCFVSTATAAVFLLSGIN